MKYQQGKIVYKADLEGNQTIEQIITDVNYELMNDTQTREYRFEAALRYDITRTVCNILSNATVKYANTSNPFCLSFQKHLTDIFFALHENGECYLTLGLDGRITSVTKEKSTIHLIDDAYRISKITQKRAARKALDMYGVVTDVAFSALSERGIMVMFSPAAGVQVLKSQLKEYYNAVRKFFGAKTGQSKVAFMEVPMTATTINLPIKEMELLANEKNAVGRVARIYGIGEDMIQSGAILANKENAIIQTYSDYKGLIYGWINQIESQRVSISINVENYSVEFPGVPQLQLTQRDTSQQLTVIQPQ